MTCPRLLLLGCQRMPLIDSRVELRLARVSDEEELDQEIWRAGSGTASQRR